MGRTDVIEHVPSLRFSSCAFPVSPEFKTDSFGRGRFPINGPLGLALAFAFAFAFGACGHQCFGIGSVLSLILRTLLLLSFGLLSSGPGGSGDV